MPSFVELNEAVYMADERLSSEMMRQGSWRGLFDVYSEEYKRSKMADKVMLLRRVVLKTGWKLAVILRTISDHYKSERPDIASAIYEGTADLLDHVMFRYKEDA